MDTNEQIERIESFLHEVIINELSKLQGIGLTYIQFVVMGQTIEVLGSLLDHKPIKVKGQANRRFRASINKLFGGRYRLLNERDFLYDKLRNQLVHAFMPGGDLMLLNRETNVSQYKHLQFVDNKLVLISEDFYEDICHAVERLCLALKEGKLKPKNIAY